MSCTNAYSFSNSSLNTYLHEEIEIPTLHSLLLCLQHLPSPNALNLCTLPSTYLHHVHLYLTLFLKATYFSIHTLVFYSYW